MLKSLILLRESLSKLVFLLARPCLPSSAFSPPIVGFYTDANDANDGNDGNNVDPTARPM